METIRFLLSFLIKLIIGMICLALVWWLVALLYNPSFSFRSFFSSFNGDFLPSPRSMSGLLGKGTVPDETTNLYVHNNESPEFITYKSENQISKGSESYYADKVLYLRNLSIYEGGHIYTNLSFVGEARETMFANGKFPIMIADNTGKIISVDYAEATTNWAIPGWVRFQVTIKAILPNKIPCTMIFQSANNSYNKQTLRVAIPIICN